MACHVRGATPGEQVTVLFKSTDGKANLDPEVAEHVFGTATADANGVATIVVRAPGSWGAGATWRYTVSANGMELGSRTFVVPGTSSKAPGSKETSGGLAKTGF